MGQEDAKFVARAAGVPVGLPCGAAREELPGFRIVELAVQEFASAVQ